MASNASPSSSATSGVIEIEKEPEEVIKISSDEDVAYSVRWGCEEPDILGLDTDNEEEVNGFLEDLVKGKWTFKPPPIDHGCPIALYAYVELMKKMEDLSDLFKAMEAELNPFQMVRIIAEYRRLKRNRGGA